MTCREKLAIEHPSMVNTMFLGGCHGCPHQSLYGYLSQPEYCPNNGGDNEVCRKCWDREIPEEDTKLNEIIDEACSLNPAIGKSELKEAAMAILDSGERREFESGAVRDIQEGKGRMDLLPWGAIMEVSKHCEAGAVKYGEHNVDKGIPTHSLCDSAARHLAKYLDGWTDEPHLVAAAWNLLWCIQMELKHKEVVDTPWIMKKENTHDTKPE